MNSNNELHVIFGTGPVGIWTMRELVKMGKRVRMVNRSGQADAPADVEEVKADAYDVKQTTELTRGATSVYQCAQPHYHEWAEKFPPLQAAILQGAAANNAKLIVCDNLYMYGDNNGQPIHADSPYKPHTKKGKIRAQMAQAILDAHQQGKVRAAIGRASNFFGPYDLIMGDIVFYPALEGNSINLLGSADVLHSFTYVPDFGRALAILGTHDESLGQQWIVPCLPAMTGREFAKVLFNEIGTPVKLRVAGKMMVRFLGLFNPSLRETVEMMYEWEKPFVVDSGKFEKAFGMTATPTETAIRETVAWFKNHPKQENHQPQSTVQQRA